MAEETIPPMRLHYFRLQRLLLEKLTAAATRMSYLKRKRIAGLFSKVVFDLLRIRRDFVIRTMVERLGIDFPEAVDLARKTYASFFTNVMEMASTPKLTVEELKERLEPKGLENLGEAGAKGCGIIMVSGHYGLWEMIPPWLALHGWSMTAVARRQKNPFVDEWMESNRTIHGVKITDSGFGLRDILRTLRHGGILGLMCDQDAGKAGIFVDFFGKPASTVPGPAVLSLKTGAPVVPMAVHPRGSGPHLFEILPPIHPGDFAHEKDPAWAITLAYSRRLEEWVRLRPDQWFWLHRRWKTPPPIP